MWFSYSRGKNVIILAFTEVICKNLADYLQFSSKLNSNAVILNIIKLILELCMCILVYKGFDLAGNILAAALSIDVAITLYFMTLGNGLFSNLQDVILVESIFSICYVILIIYLFVFRKQIKGYADYNNEGKYYKKQAKLYLDERYDIAVKFIKNSYVRDSDSLKMIAVKDKNNRKFTVKFEDGIVYDTYFTNCWEEKIGDDLEQFSYDSEEISEDDNLSDIFDDTDIFLEFKEASSLLKEYRTDEIPDYNVIVQSAFDNNAKFAMNISFYAEEQLSVDNIMRFIYFIAKFITQYNYETTEVSFANDDDDVVVEGLKIEDIRTIAEGNEIKWVRDKVEEWHEHNLEI